MGSDKGNIPVAPRIQQFGTRSVFFLVMATKAPFYHIQTPSRNFGRPAGTQKKIKKNLGAGSIPMAPRSCFT